MKALLKFAAALLLAAVCLATIEQSHSAFVPFRVNGAGVVVSAPVNTVAPVISGLSPPQVGSAQTASTGTWTNSPTGFAYQWKSAGTNVGTNANSYTPVTGDIGNTLTVTVTASNSGGSNSQASSATSAVIAASGGTFTFTALHTYYISPTGNNSNACTSGSPCLNTLGKATVCGDVWVALNGTYSPVNFDPTETFAEEWQTVGTCPSTTAGIDGTGGIQMAALICQSYLGCNFTNTANTTKYDMFVDQSHWSIQGFDFSNPAGDGNGGCFAFGTNVSAQSTTNAYVSAINNRAANCPLLGIGSGGWPGTNTDGIDEQAYIGNIAFNSAQGASECGSGMAVNIPSNFDAASGTHVFFTQNFSYGNIDGACGANSNGTGNYTTASSAAGIGATTITLGSTNHATAGWPILAYINSSLVAPSAAIPSTTISTGVTTGTTIGLSAAIVSPGVSSGQSIAVGTTTDGEGLNFDTWQQNSFTGKTVVKNNVLFGNGNGGWEMFCGGATCSSSLNVAFNNNTVYGNVQDPKHALNGWDVYLNESGNTFPLTMTNNIIQSSVQKPPGSVVNGTIGTGQPINALATSRSGYTITGNYVYSVPGVACAQFATCNSGNDIAQFNGATYTSGQTFANPGLTSPGSLPTTLISCSGRINGYDCASAAGITGDVVPTVASTSIGYQTPATCGTDADYPVWLKGMNYLTVNVGTGVITENAGLSLKPCNL